jgi:osmotically-inducible protein OsmY
VITLDGTVADAKAKIQAVELAKGTVGVTKVIDRLAVRPATTTTSP